VAAVDGFDVRETHAGSAGGLGWPVLGGFPAYVFIPDASDPFHAFGVVGECTFRCGDPLKSGWHRFEFVDVGAICHTVTVTRSPNIRIAG